MEHYHLKPTLSEIDVARTRFTQDLTALCRELEQWRTRQKKLAVPSADEFPIYDWRVARQGIFFLVLAQITVLVQAWFKFVDDVGTLVLFMSLLAISGGAGIVLLLHAQGFFSRAFWRAAWGIFRPKENYPFTPLIREIERDLEATPLLARYSDALLRGACDRIAIEETELKERLTLFGGSSPIAFVLTLLTSIWAAWQSLQKERSLLGMAILAAGICALSLTFYTIKLRFSLFELTRCRGMLDLELAVRAGKETGPNSSKT
jgi:hypothetical protein